MIIDKIHFKGYLCFQNQWSGFDEVKPINVIVGRNNTGKSHLLDFVEMLCDDKIFQKGNQYRCSGILDELILMTNFPKNTSGGTLGGNHWIDHGKKLVGEPITWEVDQNSNVCNVRMEKSELLTEPRVNKLSGSLISLSHRLSKTRFRRLLADRDIKAEKASIDLNLSPGGAGASNIVRRFILSSDPKLPRDLIQRDLRQALNRIFCHDGKFTEIQPNLHDSVQDEEYKDHWEIFLGEENKELISLSKSGSGLKTVLLVLLNLLVVPKIEQKPVRSYTFAFEELENNLHPALLRRLFQFVEEYAVKQRTSVFLSTHSSTALDFFGISKNAQVIRIIHDGKFARSEPITAHFDRIDVLAELGAKPSDLLQANGIVWVEGPSDRIYINRWIHILSNGELNEGIDYQCAFYGGALLARVTFETPDLAPPDLANLLRINPNVVVVCDSDRPSKGARLKKRVSRVKSEVQQIRGAHIWVTQAREIENYMPGIVLARAFGRRNLPDPEQYEKFFSMKGSLEGTYIGANIQSHNVDKVELASLCVKHMDREAMAPRFDWKKEMGEIVRNIRSWKM